MSVQYEAYSERRIALWRGGAAYFVGDASSEGLWPTEYLASLFLALHVVA